MSGRDYVAPHDSSTTSDGESYSSSEDQYSTSQIIRQHDGHVLDRVSGAPNASLLYEPKRPFSPYIAVGPIIGMVSETIARVLIETSDTVKVRCFLTDAHGVQHGVARECYKRVPTVFLFEELRCDTEYKVSFNIPVPGVVKSTVRTLPPYWGSPFSVLSSPHMNPAQQHQNAVYSSQENASKQPSYETDDVDSAYAPATRRGVSARIAAVSHHDILTNRATRAGGKGDMWRKLYSEHKSNPIDYLLILGNLVYVDNSEYVETKEGRMPSEGNESAFLEAYELVEDLQPSQYGDVESRILDMFRNVYRDTLSHPTLRHVLANIPCLTLPGEMELGLWLDDESDSSRCFVHKCAYQVYNEYFRALFEQDDVVGQAYHFHAFGDLGFIMLDNRAHMIHHRSSKHQHETPYLGFRQWADLDYALGDSGYLSLCRTIIVCSVSPIAHHGEATWIKASMEKQMELLNTWSCGDGLDEASLLFSKLFDWKNRKENRDVMIMCGNSTNGGITAVKDARYKDNLPIQQLTSGPMAVFKHAGASKLASPCHNGIGVHHKFKHAKITKSINSCAIADISIESNSCSKIAGQILKF